jgi:hypothetical protein
MKNKTKNIKVFSSILLTFVLLGTIFVSAFSSTTQTSETQTCNSPSFSIYFISTSKSQLQNEALTIAKDKMKNGDGGYVWQKDNYFYVISSCYENENDATLVSTQLKNNNIENEVFEIKYDALNLTCPTNTPEGKSMLTAALNTFYLTYQNLFDLSISLDTNITTETNALLQINGLFAKNNEILRNYEIIYGEYQNNVICMLNDSLTKLNTNLENLINHIKIDKTQTLLSSIRYSYIDVCRIYFDFLSLI